MEQRGWFFCCSLYQGKAVHIFSPFLPSGWQGCANFGSVLPSVPVPALHPGLLLSSVGAKEQLWGWQAAWMLCRATLAAAWLVCR